jgi:nicotinamide N-methyltransferase
MASVVRRPSVPATAVAATPTPPHDKVLKSRWSEQSLPADNDKRPRSKTSAGAVRPRDDSNSPIINISPLNNNTVDTGLADELDYITISPPDSQNALSLRPDKASRILGIKHRKSMEPIPASTRTSIVSTRSARDPPLAPFTPTLPLASLYVVSGLPKSPHTWTLADPDAVMGLHHNDGAVNRWWRPEVLGSTISPGAGGGKKKKRGKTEEVMKGAGALSKQEVGKMLSKALKVQSFPFCYLLLFLLIRFTSSLLHARSKSLPPPFNPLQLSTHLPSLFLLPTPLLHPLLLVISFVPPFCPAQITVLPRQPFHTHTRTTHSSDPPPPTLVLQVSLAMALTQ